MHQMEKCSKTPRYGTVDAACRMIGGDNRPFIVPPITGVFGEGFTRLPNIPAPVFPG